MKIGFSKITQSYYVRILHFMPHGFDHPLRFYVVLADFDLIITLPAFNFNVLLWVYTQQKPDGDHPAFDNL